MGVTAMTRVLARENSKKISFYSCCPGWIQTDMTSNNPLAKPPHEGADTPVWLATENSTNLAEGGFYRERKFVDWEKS
jgi:carbonyl reductase 1